MKRFVYVFLGLVIGLTGGLSISHQSAMAQASGWDKGEVVPVVLVEYAYGNFVPVNSPGAARWSKEEVTPMCFGEAILR